MRMLCAAQRRHLADERGSFLIEAGIAMVVLSVAVLGVVGSMGSSLNLVGNSRQRSAAVSVAQERLERVHTIPYARLALYQQPTHSNDTSNPDNAVTTDNSQYTVSASQTEPLIVDTANGALKHIDDPITLGHTEFNIYQYVTWHNDPEIAGTQDYKRVVVVVTWKYPVHQGTSHRVFQSTYIGNGSVVAPAIATPTATPTQSAAPTPTPTAAPTPTPTTSVCPGDTTGPVGNMDVVSGAGALQGYTNSTNVQVRLTADDNCAPITARLSNDPSAGCSGFSTVTTLSSDVTSNVTWTIPATDGSKTIRACFSDGAGNLSSITTATIVLDQTIPTFPGGLTKSSCTFNGNNRTLSLTWNASSDANLLGYRVYKSINQGTYLVLKTTASQSMSDTDTKSYNSLTYRITAYDKAGNESAIPNDFSLSKNSC